MSEHFAKYEAEGTVFGSINRAGFEEIVHIEPPAAVIAAFDRKAGPLDDRIEGNANEAETLAHLRAALLPRLLSGELAVGDAEHFLTEAV